MTSDSTRTSQKRKDQLNNAQKAYKKRKSEYEEKLNEQIIKIEKFSEKMDQLNKKMDQLQKTIDQEFKNTNQKNTLAQEELRKEIKKVQTFINPEKEEKQKKEELRRKEKEFKEKREKRIISQTFNKWKKITEDKKSWKEYEYHEQITWPKIKEIMKQKELNSQNYRYWYLNEKEWTGEIDEEILKELFGNDYLVIDNQELNFNLEEILLMNSSKMNNHRMIDNQNIPTYFI